MRTAMSKRKKIIMKLCMYLGYLLIAAIFIGPIVFFVRIFFETICADRIGYVKYQSIHSLRRPVTG